MFDTINKIRSLLDKVKDLGSITVANIIASATSGLFWLYIATVIGPEDYGIVSYLVAIAIIGAGIASLGTYNTIVVYGTKKEYVHPSMYTLSIISSVTVSIILYLILNKVEVSLYVVSFALFGLAQADLRSRKNYGGFSMQIISQRILLVVLAVGLFHLLGVSGIILGMALSYLPFAYRLRVGFSESKFDISKIKAKFGFMMNNYIHSLLVGVFDKQIDKIVIAAVLGFTTLGNYHLAMQFLVLMSIIPLSTGQYLLSEESSGIRHRKLKKIIILISVCLTLVGIFLAGYVLVRLFPNFTGIQNIIPILSLAIVPITINYILTSEFLGSEKSKIVMVGGIILVSTYVTGIVVLGTLYEIGIAIAYVLGTISQSIFFLTMKRRMRLNV